MSAQQIDTTVYPNADVTAIITTHIIDGNLIDGHSLKIDGYLPQEVIDKILELLKKHEDECENSEGDSVDEEDQVPEVGTCCFCGEGCNPCSQSCGRCARDMTMKSMGWK